MHRYLLTHFVRAAQKSVRALSPDANVHVCAEPCTDTNIDVRELLHGHFFALHGQNVSIHTYARTHFCGARTKFVSALSVSEFKLAKLSKMKLYLTKLVDKKIQARFTGKGSE